MLRKRRETISFFFFFGGKYEGMLTRARLLFSKGLLLCLRVLPCEQILWI